MLPKKKIFTKKKAQYLHFFPEQATYLHNLYWERPEGILINKVVYARTTSSGGVQRGENPGGNFSAERLSGEPVGSFLQLFQNIVKIF